MAIFIIAGSRMAVIGSFPAIIFRISAIDPASMPVSSSGDLRVRAQPGSHESNPSTVQIYVSSLQLNHTFIPDGAVPVLG